MITTAAAPSLMPEALPAVTVPPFLNTAGSWARRSRLVSARGPSSVSTTTGSPRRWGTETAVICPLNRPFSMAATARFWLMSASSSWSSRVTPKRSATFSAVTPMWYRLTGQPRPSVSTSLRMPSPSRRPSKRALKSTMKGVWLMFSVPPATTTSASPVRTNWAAMFMASRPDEHCLLTAMVGTSSGMPARSADSRAAYPDSAAWSALPMTTSSTASGAMLARSTAALIAAAPRSGADMSLNAPPNLPTGVRAPLTITASCIAPLPVLLVSYGHRLTRPTRLIPPTTRPAAVRELYVIAQFDQSDCWSNLAGRGDDGRTPGQSTGVEISVISRGATSDQARASRISRPRS